MIMKKSIMKYPTAEEVIKIHKKIILETGGELGEINIGNLKFVLEQIQTEFYGQSAGDIFTQASILVRGIISGHPFVDGNKRTGFEVTDIFLRRNSYFIDVGVVEGVGFAVAIATSKFNIQEIRDWLIQHTKKIL